MGWDRGYLVDGFWLGGPLLSGLKLSRFVIFGGAIWIANIELPNLFNKHEKPVMPASEPVSIAKCLLSILEPPRDGYRIKPGTTVLSSGV